MTNDQAWFKVHQHWEKVNILSKMSKQSMNEMCPCYSYSELCWPVAMKEHWTIKRQVTRSTLGKIFRKKSEKIKAPILILPKIPSFFIFLRSKQHIDIFLRKFSLIFVECWRRAKSHLLRKHKQMMRLFHLDKWFQDRREWRKKAECFSQKAHFSSLAAAVTFNAWLRLATEPRTK